MPDVFDQPTPMKLATKVYLAVNFIGIILFVWFVFKIEKLAHEEQRAYRDAVDGVTFFCTAVPVLLGCTMGSCLWASKAFVDIGRKQSFESRLRMMGFSDS